MQALHCLLLGTKCKPAAVLAAAALCGIVMFLGWAMSPASTVMSGPWHPALRLELELAVTKEIPLPRTSRRACSFYTGHWVKDTSRPLYSGTSCSQFLSSAWSCRLSSRPDFDYEKYRWQPDGCDLPKFDGRTFLSRLSGKTLAFVGDSLGRQQFQSLLCMITGGKNDMEIVDVGPEFGFEVRRRWSPRPNGWAYRFQQTNTTIMFYWSASLCRIQAYNSTVPDSASEMHLDRPPDFIKQHIDRLHVLVVNTGHHWNSGKIKGNKWEMFFNGSRVKPKSRFSSIAYAHRFAVNSVVKWLDKELVQQRGARVFLTSLSPRHFMNGEWDTGGRCDMVKPFDVELKKKPSSDMVAEDAVSGTAVELLNITMLSQERGEAHISRFGKLSDRGGQDCLHWCLPGVPDVWNELLYAHLNGGNPAA